MSIADKYRAFLEEAWNRPQQKPEDVWFYQKMLGTKFLEFVESTERVVKVLATRLRAAEDALGVSEAPAQAPSNGNGNGHAPQQSAPRGDMVRLDSMGAEMTPEEQDAEERADMMTDGKIDRSRYVPRGSGLPPQQNAQASPPPAEVVAKPAPQGNAS